MAAEETCSRRWEENYNNQRLSGIEVRDTNDKLVNFITIRHDEILGKDGSHRISLKLDENSKPIFPAPRTFDEIMQAKRRQQTLLYGPANTSSSSSSAASSSAAILSNRAARRSVAAAKNTTANARPTVIAASVAAAKVAPSPGQSTKTAPPAGPNARTAPPVASTPKASAQVAKKAPLATAELKPTVPAIEPAPKAAVLDPPEPPSQLVAQLPCEPTTDSSNNKPYNSVDPKEVKRLLKSAAPGASVVLPDGTVIKKSRRGGARVGAGRKRSRPLPGEPSPPTQTAQQSNLISMNLSP